MKYKIKYKANDIKGSKVKPILDFLMGEYGDVDFEDKIGMMYFKYKIHDGREFTIEVDERKWIEKREHNTDRVVDWAEFTDRELSFFDDLGYTISDRFEHRMKQNIRDWWNK